VATVAFRTKLERYRRLAHMIAFTLVLSTATISFLGVTLVFALNVFWPRFWHGLFRVMFWPFILEAVLFLGEAVFAYSWYYLWSWSLVTDWRRTVHLSFAWLAAGCAVAAMFMIDITASYMLTPHPIDAAWANVFNPSMIHLHLHRWFGNLTWTGFALAALCAIAWRRSAGLTDRGHYQWAAAFCFAIGFGALLVMPVIGFQYLLNLRYAEPQIFHVLMLGQRSWLFDLVALLYGGLVVLGSTFILLLVLSRAPASAPSRTFLPISVGLLAIATAVVAQPYHLQNVPLLASLTDRPINPIGKMQPYKYLALGFLVVFGFLNWSFFLRWFPWNPAARAGYSGAPAGGGTQFYLLVTVAVTAMLMMLSMGWVRETARASDGYLIYGHVSFEDERSTYEGPSAESSP
jgi:cytochrome bd ubiquinol oxidase subunit I